MILTLRRLLLVFFALLQSLARLLHTHASPGLPLPAAAIQLAGYHSHK
jgi:hypothetical protein